MKSDDLAFEPCEVEEVDDILITRLTGDYTLKLAEKLQDRVSAMGARYGYRLLLLNVERMGAVHPEVRRYLAEDQKRQRTESSLAIVGANFAIRTVAVMLTRAVSILAKLPVSVEFFHNEEQALTWLRRERNRLRVIIAAKGA